MTETHEQVTWPRQAGKRASAARLVTTEDDLKRAVMDLCKLLGLYVHHCRPARTAAGWRTPIEGDAGFPDLVISGPGGVLFRELKARRGVMSLPQQMWEVRLKMAKADFAVWRPADLASGRIERELKEIRYGPPRLQGPHAAVGAR